MLANVYLMQNIKKLHWNTNFGFFFTTLHQILPKFCPKFPIFFCWFPMKFAGDSININNLCCNLVVLKKVGKTLWVQFVQKRSHYGPHQKWKTFFWAKINKADYQLSETFYFIKTSYAYVLTELWIFFCLEWCFCQKSVIYN